MKQTSYIRKKYTNRLFFSWKNRFFLHNYIHLSIDYRIDVQIFFNVNGIALAILYK